MTSFSADQEQIRLSSPEILTDAEVQERFDEMITHIDEEFPPEREARIDTVIVAKVNGNEEEFSMWREHAPPPPA